MDPEKRKLSEEQPENPNVKRRKVERKPKVDNILRIALTDEPRREDKKVKISRGKTEIIFDANAALFMAKRLVLLYTDVAEDEKSVLAFQNEITEIADDFYAYIHRREPSPYTIWFVLKGPVYMPPSESPDSIDKTRSEDMEPIQYKEKIFKSNEEAAEFKEKVKKLAIIRDERKRTWTDGTWNGLYQFAMELNPNMLTRKDRFKRGDVLAAAYRAMHPPDDY